MKEVLLMFSLTVKGFRHITSKISIYFGKLKPKDEYQVCLIDSLLNNQMIMVRGTAVR